MTRILMTGSALFLAVPGLLGTFAPDELLARLGAPGLPILLLTVQVLGAAFLGFAALNWMARANLVGGIYSRPLVIANLMHFLVGALAMLRLLTRAPELQHLWLLTLGYAVFAAAFGLVLFHDPVPASAAESAPAQRA